MNPISKFLNAVTDRVAGIYKQYNSVIILAAGSGSRAKTKDVTKQQMLLDGIPVVARTVSVFDSCPFVNEIIVVAREEELSLYEKYRATYGWKKLARTVLGGDTRADSVLCGFKAISDRSDYVYIHDGARCLVTEEMIARVGHAACMHGAAIAAVKATDTVKLLDGDKLTTTDRDKVYLAQTPQVFKTELYRAAAYTALQKGITATDDAMLAEAAGFSVVPVDCGSENMKITHPCDFAIAEAILRYRKEKSEVTP